MGVGISIGQRENLNIRHWNTGYTLKKYSEIDIHLWVLDQVPLGLSCPGLSPDS